MHLNHLFLFLKLLPISAHFQVHFPFVKMPSAYFSQQLGTLAGRIAEL